MSNSNNSDEKEEAQAVSRRDFLRRASKEAVTTGVSLVPGAHLAQAALGVNIGPAAEDKKGWWQRLLAWRRERVTDTEVQDETKGTEE